jgi:hypothetical protein
LSKSFSVLEVGVNLGFDYADEGQAAVNCPLPLWVILELAGGRTREFIRQIGL